MIRTISCIHALLLAGVCVAVTAPLAHAQTRTVTLEALEQQALASRQSLSAQQARIRRAAAEVERRRSAYNPSITLGSDVALSPGGTLEHVAGVDLNPAHEILVQGIRKIGDRDAFAAQARYGATLDISMNLYDFGRTALAVEAARAEQAAASADDQATRRQVMDDVRTAYLAWLTAIEVATLSEQAVADAQARHQRVVDLVAEGMKPAADISPVASDEALARLEASRSRANVENARIMLDAAIGGGLPADAEPDRRALQIDLLPSSIAGGKSESSADAAVHALERQRDAARATASMYDRLHAPVIGADAQVGVRAQNPIVGGGLSGVFPMYRVGVSVSVPLWDGGSASANANVARAQAEELGARSRELSQARQTVRSQAEADAAAAQERLRIARELLALSERRVREAEERYEEAGGPVEAIAEANAMRRRANAEIVLAEIATARAHYALQDQ
jgi:outer membrane protein TolC